MPLPLEVYGLRLGMTAAEVAARCPKEVALGTLLPGNQRYVTIGRTALAAPRFVEHQGVKATLYFVDDLLYSLTLSYERSFAGPEPLADWVTSQFELQPGEWTREERAHQRHLFFQQDGVEVRVLRDERMGWLELTHLALRATAQQRKAAAPGELTFDIVAGESVGPFRLGMRQAEVERVGQPPILPSPEDRSVYFSSHGVRVFFDEAGRCHKLSAYVSKPVLQSVRFVLFGQLVNGLSKEKLVELFSREAPVKRSHGLFELPSGGLRAENLADEDAIRALEVVPRLRYTEEDDLEDERRKFERQRRVKPSSRVK